MFSLKVVRLNVIKSRLFVCSSNCRKSFSLSNEYSFCQQALPQHTLLQCANPYLASKLHFSTTLRLNAEDTGTKEHIEKLVKNNKVVVFMKGNPEKPMCGFSNAVVQILRMHGVTYDSHNVLEDEALRSGIKTFSDWPTIPQVYFNGEFVGGCDILLQMHQSGDLIDELKTIGIRSALLDEK